MIIFYTNVMAEPLRQKPFPSLVEWLDQQRIEIPYLTAITAGEICYGLATVASGQPFRRSPVL